MADEKWNEQLISLFILYLCFIAASYYYFITMAKKGLGEKEAKRLQKDSENRFRILAENATDMISMHYLNGQFKYVSPSCESLTGYNQDELLDMEGLNFVTSEDAGYIADRFKNILQEQEVKAVRYQIISKDGRTHWFETSGRLIKTPHQRRKYQLVAVTRNIDKTVDFENELQKANKKIHESLIEAQSANIAKSQFLATMSHELRTPLNAVIGFSEMISHEGHGEVQPKYKEYAGYIHDSGNKLLHIICDILELSKIHTGKIDLDKKPIDLSHIIRDCCDIMKGCVKDAELCLDNHVTDHCPKMIADAQAIKQMLTNILSNAVKYTSPGGKNDISYHMGKHELKLFIEDTGIGICRQDLEKVLEPFTQVEQTRLHHQSGIGLGLPLAKALIELHDGSLLLEVK